MQLASEPYARVSTSRASLGFAFRPRKARGLSPRREARLTWRCRAPSRCCAAAAAAAVAAAASRGQDAGGDEDAAHGSDGKGKAVVRTASAPVIGWTARMKNSSRKLKQVNVRICFTYFRYPETAVHHHVRHYCCLCWESKCLSNNRRWALGAGHTRMYDEIVTVTATSAFLWQPRQRFLLFASHKQCYDSCRG